MTHPSSENPNYDALMETLFEEEQESKQPRRLGFHEAMDDCDSTLIRLGRAVAAGIHPMTEAFLAGDADIANELSSREVNIENACAKLEERCFVLIARQSPVASDLRRLVALVKMTWHVSRAGALLAHVGESLTWVHPPSISAGLRDTVQQLGVKSEEILSRGLQAFEDRDILAANELDELDDEVDLLQKVLVADLYTGIQSVEESVTLGLISRYYERIADHGVELARLTTYIETGERPPHHEQFDVDLTDPDF